MTEEEKYKRAFEIAKEVYHDHRKDRYWRDWLTKLFPELKESEDERIVKCLLNYFNHVRYNGLDLKGTDVDEVIAWLEKQRENKPTDKIEPKFHEGDWVVYNNDICQIVKREEGCNKLVTVFGIEKELVNERNLSTARLWSIQDAKDGDVLVENSCIFIIQKLGDNSTAAKTYCTLYNDGDFDDGSILYFDIDSTKPATKEQRDMLFQKMKEAGYEWDVEKKELNKIESKTLDANKVIEWLKPYSVIVDNIIDEFKKDFGL